MSGSTRGFSHLHMWKHVRRDLNPENVRMPIDETSALVPKNADFGWARSVLPMDEEMTPGAATAPWGPPDMHAGVPYSRRRTSGPWTS